MSRRTVLAEGLETLARDVDAHQKAHEHQLGVLEKVRALLGMKSCEKFDKDFKLVGILVQAEKH